MRRVPLGATVVAAVLGVSPANATDYNVIHLDARGCPQCKVTVTGVIERFGEVRSHSGTVALYRGVGTAWVPKRFNIVGLEVEDPKRQTGWNSVTTVALRYRGFQLGDSVSNRQSRRAKWAQDCLAITERETWVGFRVVRDRNPTKWKRKDPTWTKFSLRAWASPQLAGYGLFTEAFGGRSSVQNSSCGLRP